jgi:hypothetical protein
MRLVVQALAVLIASAGSAQAEPQALPSFNSELVASRASHRQFALRSDYERSVRPSAFIAALSVAPNAMIGLGRFNCLPRRRLSMHDQPVTMERKTSRRAAVGLSLKF